VLVDGRAPPGAAVDVHGHRRSRRRNADCRRRLKTEHSRRYRPWTVRVAISQNGGSSWAIHNVSGSTPVFTGPQSASLNLTYDMLGPFVDNGGYLHLAYPRRVTKDGIELNQVEYTRQVTGQPLGTR
jgi:hypothetical protein